MSQFPDDFVIRGGLCPSLCFNWLTLLKKQPLDECFVDDHRLKIPIYAAAHYLAEQLHCPEVIHRYINKVNFSQFINDASEFLDTLNIDVQPELCAVSKVINTNEVSAKVMADEDDVVVKTTSEDDVPIKKKKIDRFATITRVREEVGERRGRKPSKKIINLLADLDFDFVKEGNVERMNIIEALQAAGFIKRSVTLIETGLGRLSTSNNPLVEVHHAFRFIGNSKKREYKQIFYAPHQISIKISEKLCSFFLKLNEYCNNDRERGSNENKDNKDKEEDR